MDTDIGFRAIAAAQDCIKLTKGNPAYPVARSLLVGTAGTVNIRTVTGAVRNNVPLQQGYNPIQTTELLAGGTADDIWALY